MRGYSPGEPKPLFGYALLMAAFNGAAAAPFAVLGGTDFLQQPWVLLGEHT